MQRYDEDQEHIERLAEDIRKLGTPYISPEPDSRYWAGLRVNIMERIAEREQRGFVNWTNRTREFISEHLLGTSLAGAAAAVVIAMTVIMHPFDSNQTVAPPMAIQSMPVRPATPTPEVMKDLKKELAQRAEDLEREPTHPAERIASHRNNESVRKQPDLASLDGASLDAQSEIASEPVLGQSAQDDPVSLNELSTPELESVLQSMDHAK